MRPKSRRNYFKENENLRSSMPDLINKSYYEYFSEDPEHPNESLIQKINRKLLEYKEIKYLSRKTHIPPIYYAIVLIFCLLFIVIGFFDDYLTIFIATAYPLYASFKTLQYRAGYKLPDGKLYTEEDGQNDITQWLTYWVVYSFFINIECLFGNLLRKIPLYFFMKVTFLLMCFLPQYQLASIIYNHLIRTVFLRYEDKIREQSIKIVKTITEEELEGKKVKENHRYADNEMNEEGEKIE